MKHAHGGNATHGGKRPGAGRPKLPDDKRKQRHVLYVSPQMKRFLAAIGADQVEAIISKTAQFKRWKDAT